MHELSIAQGVLEGVRAALVAYPGARPERVRLAVGELTAIEPELLSFAWDAMVADLPEAGCALEIEWRPACQVCPHCRVDTQRPPGGWLQFCGTCGGVLRVEGGRELDLLQVSFVVPDGEEVFRDNHC